MRTCVRVRGSLVRSAADVNADLLSVRPGDHQGADRLRADTIALGLALRRVQPGVPPQDRRESELLGEADRAASMTGNRNRVDNSVTASNTEAVATGSERKAAHEARKLAAIPEPVFEEYVDTTEAPTKAGLLRAALGRC